LLGRALQGKHYEAAVSLLAAAALIGLRVVSWSSIKRIPYSTLILLGGSFAMAAGIEASGLGTWMAERVAVVSTLEPLAALLVVSGASVGLSALASNTATINVLLNIVPRDPTLWTAAGLAASMDFMLPAGTPPNAIVFGSGRIRLPTMIRVGLLIDLAAVLVVALYGWLWIARWF
jgi:sodium-dependent dicarboxylate transporter 2/3/5